MSGSVRIAGWLGVFSLVMVSSLAGAGETYTAEGVVLGPDGRPVAEAHVVFYPSYGAIEPHSELTTGADGKYAFSARGLNAEGAQGLIVVRKEGLAWNCRRWLLLDNLVADIRLDQPSELTGVVVDAMNAPVAGATVSLQAPRSRDVRSTCLSERLARRLFTTGTDDQGRFRFLVLAGDWRTDFQIAAPGYATLRTRHLPDALYRAYGPGQADLRFTLQPEAQVRGTVARDSDGAPLSNVEVRIGRTQSSVASGFESAVTDEAGRFLLRGIPAGDFWLGAATSRTPDPNVVGRPVPVRVKAGQTTEGVELKLTRGGTLEVQVRNEQGAPIEGAWLSVCECEGHHSGSGRTDAQGVCRVRLPEGEHKLVDTGKHGYHSCEPHFFFDMEKDRTVRREVILKKADRIGGLVVDVDGRPVPDVRVTLMPSPVGSVVTDQRGRFTMIWDKWSRAYESHGRTQFELIVRDRRGDRAATLVPSESSRTFRLELQPTVTVVGSVVDAQNKPVERVLVSSWLRGQGRWAWGMNLSPNQRVFTDPAGRFAARCVPAERTCEIRCRAPGYEQIKREFQTPAATSEPFDIGTITLAPKAAEED